VISAPTSWESWINISFPAPQLVNQKYSITKCKIYFQLSSIVNMLHFGIFTNILCEVLGYLKSFDSD
jgi:hypothetical protein